jgi:hypothetical protein
MPGLTESQLSVLRTVFGAASNPIIADLEQALAGEASRGGPIAAVHELLSKEAVARRVRAVVFEPIMPMCRPSPVGGVQFPAAAPVLLWAALSEAAPAEAQAAEAASLRPADDETPPDPVFDELCLIAAQNLRNESPGFTAVIERLDKAQAGGAEDFASYLDLAPITRPALMRLPEWVGRMSDERAAAARLAYRDAVALSEDAGPRFFETLLAHLPEPWAILRVMSAVMTHPGDRYVAVSELAKFGEYILADVDRRLAEFKAFDPTGGAEAGRAAGDILHVASQEIAEFETSIELARDGPWGSRIAAQRRQMAQSAEARLGQIDKALDAALPLKMVRFGKGLKGLPKLAEDPDPAAVRKAEGLMAFFDACHASAGQSGYGAARAKAAEKIGDRLDQYVEDLLEILRAEEIEGGAERVHLYLEITAQFLEAARDEKAGQIVRRRAAAA